MNAIFLAATLATAAPIWWGTETVQFNTTFPGDPFDYRVNDVRVKFTHSISGETTWRLAYWDNGKWNARLKADKSGPFVPVLYRNGVAQAAVPVPPVVTLTEPDFKGFIGTHPQNPRKFAFQNGDGYFPIGYNVAWTKPPWTIAQHFQTFESRDLNWSRVWSVNWDNRNPWWAEFDPSHNSNTMWEPALDNWDQVFQDAEANGVYLQMVFFNHGSFSEMVDADWDRHPWSQLHTNPIDPFRFDEDTGDALYETGFRLKMFIRYAIARYGHYRSLMGWELFNEVEYVGYLHANQHVPNYNVDRWNEEWEVMIEWHDKTATFIRSLDPYGHLITTSSSLDRPALWASMDYIQPHLYPWSTTTLLDRFDALPHFRNKPIFVGETGAVGTLTLPAIRDGMMEGIVRGHAGAGMPWYWEELTEGPKRKLVDDIAKMVSNARLSDGPNLNANLMLFDGSSTVRFVKDGERFFGKITRPAGTASSVPLIGFAKGTYDVALLQGASPWNFDFYSVGIKDGKEFVPDTFGSHFYFSAFRTLTED